MHRFEWPDEGVEFHLPHGEWIDLLRANGFEIERLIELQAPDDAVTHEYYAYVTRRVGAQVAGRRDLGRPQGDERPPAPPLLLASTSPQRRAILDAAAGSPSRSSRPTTRRSPGTGPLERAAGKARSVDGGRAAGARRRHRGAARRRAARQAGERDRGRGDARARSPGGRTRSSRGSACARSRGRSCARRRRCVTFRALTPRELAHYVASREWEGRAGAYAIQGLGASLVERIEGDYLNVVGLPGALLVRVLADAFPGVYGFG